MRNLHARPLASAAAASLALACALALLPRSAAHTTAAAQRRATDTYAITNARVVTVSGATVERGTVVVRDGLIAAVGANVSAPPDARVIDGTGLSVYPGLIDANTTLAIPRPTPAAGATPANVPFAAFLGPQMQPSAVSPNSANPPGLQPEILASDVIRPGGEQIEAARNAGVTAALTAPRGQIFMGQSAVINLAGDTPQAMLVRSPVALHVGFTPLFGQYPGSLMGVFSAVRQMLLDAQRYAEASEIYERNPRGLRRPELDKSLAALQPVLARRMPVVMQAEREREIIRALDLAREFNLQLVIAGGTDSWRVADRLKAQNVPVLLSLNFPRRTTAESPEADPEPLRVLRERAEAPKTAARLSAAGVRFAFQSGGMTNMADYLGNAVRAVENGLARDEAVRALTLRAAQLLGVEDRLGSIEVGKIANLTVTRGDLLDRTRTITHVFIDGRPAELRPATSAPGAAAGVAGSWSLRLNMGGLGDTSEVNVTLQLQQQGERVTGGIQGPLGSAQIANASLGAAGELRFTVPLNLNREQTEANFVATVSGNEMRGTFEVVGRGTGTFVGTRAGGSMPQPTPGATPMRPSTTPPGSPQTSPNPPGQQSTPPA
ncbi:MAG TPA: amidohydrolase family protein [Pyrinomonadaceae bacterium]|nr:amidohydrolase family protein [Pyrinomonadaceae bacterium]